MHGSDDWSIDSTVVFCKSFDSVIFVINHNSITLSSGNKGTGINLNNLSLAGFTPRTYNTGSVQSLNFIAIGI